MLTPFQSNGKIDFKLLTSLTEFYINAGARGLFANCLSSEMFELSPDERIAITKHVVDVVAGEVPVVSTGSFSDELAVQIEFIKEINDTGVQSVILSSGVMVSEKESDEDFENKFGEILHATSGINFGFYECPVPYKRIVSPDLLSKFVKSGRVNYFKDTCLDLEMVTEKIRRGADYEFGLYDAYIVHAVDSLKAGAAGLSCIQGNFFPELIVWLCNHYNHPEHANEVARVQRFLASNMDVMHDVYPTVAKIFLKKRGLEIETFSRREVGKITSENMAGLNRLLSDYAQIENNLEINSVI